jgi:hypothetical protein
VSDGRDPARVPSNWTIRVDNLLASTVSLPASVLFVRAVETDD